MVGVKELSMRAMGVLYLHRSPSKPGLSTADANQRPPLVYLRAISHVSAFMVTYLSNIGILRRPPPTRLLIA